MLHSIPKEGKFDGINLTLDNKREEVPLKYE